MIVLKMMSHIELKLDGRNGGLQQYWLETDKAAYLVRQYFFNNIHDRLSTRPFLSLVEKKWLAFQLLYAVKQSHENGVCHGDIKCENVLVTSWNWLYLADFASFKPTYIPDDDPSDFSFFFDTGGRRRCYLAPERFYEHGGEAQVAQDAPLRPSMDVFSAGDLLNLHLTRYIANLDTEVLHFFREVEVPKVNHFRYPGSIIQNDGNIENDVTHRIQAGRKKWRSATGVICDRNVPTKLKGKFYRTAIRPAMLYGSECWVVKQQQLHKMNVAEMRMLRWMCGKTRKDRIRNIEIQRQVGVAPIDTKIRKGVVVVWSHCKDRPTNAPTRKLDSIESCRNSTSCVIAELFLEGQPLFELSQLLAYRRGQYDPSQTLEKIQDSGIRKLILHMIQLDPDSRLSAETYLQSYATVAFPSYFSPFLHNFYSCLIPLDSDTRVAVAQSAFHDLHKQMMIKPSEEINGITCASSDSTSTESCQQMNNTEHKINDSLKKKGELEMGLSGDQFELLSHITKLLKEVEQNSNSASVKPQPKKLPTAVFGSSTMRTCSQCPKNLVKQSSGKLFKMISSGYRERKDSLKKIIEGDLVSLISEYNNESDASGIPSFAISKYNVNCQGMVLIASLLCSCIRSVKLPQLRRAAVLLLRSCSLYIDDEDRLQRVLPYVIAMLSDSAAIVRCAALETLCDILPLVRDFTPSDAKIFPEYILPMLSMLPDDPEESVRICYAGNISKLALTAYRFLIQSQGLAEAGVLEKYKNSKSSAPSVDTLGKAQGESSDILLAQLRKSVAEIVQELVMSTKQTPNIRIALLKDIGNLCCFFGQRQCNDFLLPILPAFLNDRDEHLREVFYGKIVYVCFFVGQRSVEEYLLPYIEQALSDTTEVVIVNALECLATLCKSNFLQKKVILDMIERAFPLLCYPSQWVRRSVITFIAACSESLGSVDSCVYLVPVIRPFLRRQPASLASEKSVMSCLKPPVSKQVFYHVLENARSSDMLERQRKICWPGRLSDVQGYRPSSSLMQQSGLPNEDDDTKFRSMGSFTRSASSAIDIRDPLCFERLQFSGFISPQVGGGNSFSCDGTSENIPLYSFSVDKRAELNSAGSDSSDGGSLENNSSSNWVDPINRSNISNSVVTPKLVTGSLSFNTASKQFCKVLRDSEGRETDLNSYISNKFEEISFSGSSKGTSSISDISSPSEVTPLPSFARGSQASSVTDTGWRPRGVLVAHLQEHRSAVNDIAISSDHNFFVSTSDDSTVKIWDTKKLEKDISFRSRLTYSLNKGRALCAAMLSGSAQVVVGASDGTIHFFSVDYVSRGLGNVVERYSGVADIKKREVGEGAILSLLNYSTDVCPSQMVMYSTLGCKIHLWDTRTNSTTWTLKATPEEGYISSLVTGSCGNWFVSGSSRGVLTLWDMRFLVPVNSWKFSNVCPVEKMSLFIPPPNISPAAARPLVYVAAGSNEVSLWNAENGSCHQVLRQANNGNENEMSDLPWALARSSGKSNSKQDVRRSVNSRYRVDELNEPPPHLPGIRSLLSLPGGDLLTGGTDLRIRHWDHFSPDRSYCVCGPSMKGTGNDEVYEARSCCGVQVVQEAYRRPPATKMMPKTLLAAAATDSAGCHRDAILSLASVKLSQRILISSSRDGAIKVWK
ncbi:hypothetical protein Scep_024554 [Stephania cephalantha]|uniref:non-specific serine/threonine protein kinase n=1 Tax=Stephania cephalantha TaxID=152367 RepID=A0AAP0F5R5_9MAGN